MKSVVLFISAVALFALPAGAATNQFSVTASGSSNYIINGVNDPPLTLVRGFTYTFNVNASSHPFYIKTLPVAGTGSQYNTGVTGQGTTSGPVTFAVPNSAPNTLHYICSTHPGMTAALTIVDAPSVAITSFDVGENIEILSTGTDNLNLRVQSLSSLTNTVWTPLSILSHSFSGGTNTTKVELPAGDAAFFQIEQGFF